MAIKENRYLPVWFPAIGLHLLHQVEESISFFDWYAANAGEIAPLARIVSVAHAEAWSRSPGMFATASAAQILAVCLIAFAFRRHEAATRFLLLTYIAGITFFLTWHIVIAWQAHSYPPIMVTCIGGLYLIPRWVFRILKP